MSITKSVPLKSYSSMKKVFKKIRIIFDIFDFESQNFAIFDNFYSTDRNKLFKGLVINFGPLGRPGRMCDSER